MTLGQRIMYVTFVHSQDHEKAYPGCRNLVIRNANDQTLKEWPMSIMYLSEQAGNTPTVHSQKIPASSRDTG